MNSNSYKDRILLNYSMAKNIQKRYNVSKGLAKLIIGLENLDGVVNVRIGPNNNVPKKGHSSLKYLGPDEKTNSDVVNYISGGMKQQLQVRLNGDENQKDIYRNGIRNYVQNARI